MGEGVQTRFSFFSLLYGTPANCAESQRLEAWPASIYGHLREWYISLMASLTLCKESITCLHKFTTATTVIHLFTTANHRTAYKLKRANEERPHYTSVQRQI